MPSKAASACDSCHVGWGYRRAACASCDASAIIGPTPAAANKNVFLMVCHLFRLSPGAQKSVFRRETQSIASPHRSVSDRPASASHRAAGSYF
jgi:hypothetical protein